MQNGFHYDGVLKDLFQRDHPSLLDQLTGGVGVKEFLNVELPKVLERRLDLVVRLADESIFHLEFQGDNDGDMPYREGVYCFLLGGKYRVRIRQAVLYVGRAKMRMADRVDLGDTRCAYRTPSRDSGEEIRPPAQVGQRTPEAGQRLSSRALGDEGGDGRNARRRIRQAVT